MKRIAYIFAAVLALAAGGCSQVESNRAAPNVIAHFAHMHRVDDLEASGTLTSDESNRLLRMVGEEQQAIDAYYTAIEEGDSGAMVRAKSDLARAAAATEAELAMFPSRGVPR